jgi:hypothetical protein
MLGLGVEHDRRRRQLRGALQDPRRDGRVRSDGVEDLTEHRDSGPLQFGHARVEQLGRRRGRFDVDRVLAGDDRALDDVQHVHRAPARPREWHRHRADLLARRWTSLNRRDSHGATNTANSASSSPQPVNV